MTDLYDQEDELTEAEVCPVCLEPWGDINHVVFWREVRDMGTTGAVVNVRYVMGCTREVQL